MNKQDESVCFLIRKNDYATNSICQALASEGATAIVKQEGSEPETVGSHWSGQPGKDLFFNSWKLLF
ncbi:hypothetical protein [Spirosoma arcticum]